MGGRVIVLYLESSLCIYVEAEALGAVCRNTLSYMDGEIVLLDSIDD